MSGGRALLGILVPSVNTVVEPDMYRMAPEGVALITARLHVPTADLSDETAHENQTAIVNSVEEAIRMLPLDELVGIGFCCTGASFYRGGGWDCELASHIETVSGKPAVTTSGAIVAGLQCLGIRRVGIASPYVDSQNSQLRDFLAANGFEVVAVSALKSKNAYENARQSYHTIYELARQAMRERVESIVIPCTNLPAAHLVEQLETDLGKLVVSANQATFWQMLRTVGIREPVHGFGRLLRL